MNNVNNDMVPELFILSRDNNEFLVPPKSKDDYLKDLEGENSPEIKGKALSALVEIYRLKTVNNGGKYTDEICSEIINLLEKYGLDPTLSGYVVGMLVGEGGYCEGVGDFQNATRFYESSLLFEVKDSKLRYFRLNNLAFCLNYMRRFEKAEKLLREAVEIDPRRYNAWKNLGVCLEHQVQFEEAAECYFKAVIFSHGEKRSIAHLHRLVERCPGLKEIPQIDEFSKIFSKE